jgi:MtfA peptidase
MVFLLMLGIFCYIVFYMLYSIYKHFSLGDLSYFIPLKPEYRKILLNKFPYYRQLNFRNRQKFQHRLKYFLKDKNFYGREHMQITDEMKILVGAAAVQVTL